MLQGDNAQPSSQRAAAHPEPVSTVVLAAGEGTRMRSATPKVLHRIAGRPLVEHAVRAAAAIVTVPMILCWWPACAATPTLIKTELPTWVLGLPWLGLIGMTGTLVMLPWLASRIGKFRELLSGLGWSEGRHSRWWAAVGLSIIVQAFATLQVILLGLAMGLTVPWTAYVVVVPLVTLFTMVLPSLNGIGVREGGFSYHHCAVLNIAADPAKPNEDAKW